MSIGKNTLINMPSFSFEQIWQLPLPWFEQPNEHRGGWSGVLKWVPEDSSPLFIKKQENYIKRTLRHPIQGELTAGYENKNLKKLEALSIPAPEVTFFSEKRVANLRRAILVTKSLEGYLPLDEWLAKRHPLDLPLQTKFRQRLAELLSKLHRNRLAHCSLYPKHIFVKEQQDDFKLAFIDLEKLRFKPFRFLCTMHDLNKLNRHLFHGSCRERLLFLKAYLSEMNLVRFYPFFKWYLWKNI